MCCTLHVAVQASPLVSAESGRVPRYEPVHSVECNGEGVLADEARARLFREVPPCELSTCLHSHFQIHFQLSDIDLRIFGGSQWRLGKFYESLQSVECHGEGVLASFAR